jgi:hypothetical protein
MCAPAGFDDVEAAVRRAFVDSFGEFAFCITGDLPPDRTLRRMLDDELGTVAVRPSASPERPTQLPSCFPRRDVREVLRCGSDPKARVRILFGGNLEPGCRCAAHAARAAARILERRLLTRLRSELGRVYSVSCFEDIGSPVFEDSFAITSASFTCSPDHAEGLLEEAVAIMRQASVPSDAEMQWLCEQVQCHARPNTMSRGCRAPCSGMLAALLVEALLAVTCHGFISAHLHRDCAHCCHICIGTALTAATSALGLGSATSAPGVQVEHQAVIRNGTLAAWLAAAGDALLLEVRGRPL